ncbi:CRISPR-associated helicase Cas3' [Nitrosophilus labii]|uniref:CRISPR-associated helicase Cas3' n=1 Tax=Nitrosophilus labii TaxID=2706014 RepID=UPI001657540C|nr:CRISPR-associated helicase Cas3' [Nitrosophilus labii]
MNILSHTHPTKPPEKLEEHKALVKKYLQKIFQEKEIDLEKIIESFKLQDREFAKKLIFDAIVSHDEGKRNPAFQYLKMGNKDFKEAYEKMDVKSSKHSFLGAKMFFEKYIDEVASEVEDEEFYKKLFLLTTLCFIISKHHAKLDDFEKFVQKLKSKLQEEGSAYVEFELDFSYFDIETFIAIKLIYSLLISADYYATLEYMTDIKTESFGLLDIKKAKEEFEDFAIVRNIRAGDYEKEIDKLRSLMFLESQKSLDKSKNIFYLQAPTGAGKTLMSLNLALKLEPKKIFYIFPFNTLVEQTKEKIEEIFSSLDFAVINSITPIALDEENDPNLYEKTYLQRLFYHYELILTTHVNLFEILFGIGKEANFPLWQLYGSVIILDEIQSYDNNLWWYMVEFLNAYAKVLDLKIIIMSATLPKIDRLLEKKDEFVELLDSRKYFIHPLFKDRVEVDFSLLDRKIDFEILKEKVLEANKVLVEFIKKRSAREFYEYIKDLDGYEVYELSGDDNKLFRQKVIERTRMAEKIVIVATQVIEAGVDIDMELGLKDISTFDSDEQFLGRINRNALRKGRAYFFNYDKTEDIYRGDNRLDVNLQNKEVRDYFLQKDFGKCYEVVLKRLDEKKNKYSGLQTIKDKFIKLLQRLEYKEIYEKMQLIRSSGITIFFPYRLKIDEEFRGYFEREYIEDGYLDGEMIWQRLKELSAIENYAQKEIEKSKLWFYMQFFTFNLPFVKKLDRFSDECCGIYLFADFEEYIDEDYKFDRDKFMEEQNKKFGFL